MSTFRGCLKEFPEIKIDFFRQSYGVQPPLACFLSHVHSDHLAGLETLKAPFIYCSPATREILLRLEKYPHRMNFALGILETRKQTYKHLEKLLRPIPLDTPTEIELEPGNIITVTLFDANHCPGSVMFLIENEKKSILYTGDIRSEASFITSICANPHLIDYANGLKTLDCIYLDTSNLGSNISFPSQAEGLTELLQRVKGYPDNTIFHFSAWTYGYEKVWVALSKSLKAQVHVDQYKMRIYKSLAGQRTSQSALSVSPEGPSLAGFVCGNSVQDGCLTEDPLARIHSCEKDLDCPTIRENKNVVWITPIIARTQDGTEIAEIGVGGGVSDLRQHTELEISTEDDIEAFLDLLDSEFCNREEEEAFRSRLQGAIRSSRLVIPLHDLGLAEVGGIRNKMPLKDLVNLIAKSSLGSNNNAGYTIPGKSVNVGDLPRRITFPFSRHSSYPELCELVKVFQPKDVYPCTVDEENWHEGLSVANQFGKYCSGSEHRHDREMRHLIAMQYVPDEDQQTHTTESDDSDNDLNIGAVQNLVRDYKTENERGSVLEHRGETPSLSIVGKQESPTICNVVQKSPGTQSQNLRRSLIIDELEERRSKKIRWTTNNTHDDPAHAGDGVLLSSDVTSIDLVPENTGAFQQSPPPKLHSSGSSDEDELVFGAAQSDQQLLGQSSEDTVNIHRCGACERECWSTYDEYCDNCRAGTESPPYYEDWDCDDLSQGCFNVALDEFTEQLEDDDSRRRYVGEYLDVDSSAYDTQDERCNFQEDYEVNSFIDDSTDSQGDENSTNSDDGMDEDRYWEEKFRNLQAKHEAIILEHTSLRQEQMMTLEVLEKTESLYYDLLEERGISTPGEDSDVENGRIIMVHPATPDPLITEIIVPSLPQQAQEAATGGTKANGRDEIVQLVIEGTSSPSHDHSLMTGNDHIEGETEL